LAGAAGTLENATLTDRIRRSEHLDIYCPFAIGAIRYEAQLIEHTLQRWDGEGPGVADRRFNVQPLEWCFAGGSLRGSSSSRIRGVGLSF